MPYALLSVSDKTGLVPFAKALVERGWTLLSTGGTQAALREAGVPVTSVSEHTGQPEMMDGRVKTLHPKIHGGILGLRDKHLAEAEKYGVPWIDLVAVNLYPFEATVARQGTTWEEAVEQIDIGGPTMVRSAAKNHLYVTICTDPTDYEAVLSELVAQGRTSLETRKRLAIKAFRHTAFYDGLVSGTLAEWAGERDWPVEMGLPLRLAQTLRYGENPHQTAAFYRDPLSKGRSLSLSKQLQGKELSFNNLADLDAAVRAVFELDEPACAIIKHMNPCGLAIHQDGPARAYGLALKGDPVSAFGGIVAFNRPLTGQDVAAVRASKVFFEVLAAPGFDDDAREQLTKRENLRVMELPADWLSTRASGLDARRIQGGWLFQDWDANAAYDWRTATKRGPTPEETRLLRFAWHVCRSVKSNAIVLASAHDGGILLNGVGAGQMSRVDSVRLAVSKAPLGAAGSVLASDAFFPFPDGVERAVEAGIVAFVQPGGSIRDEEVLKVVDQAGGTMVLTGTRHFRH